MRLNEKIMVLRKKNGWSQERLAEMVGRLPAVGVQNGRAVTPCRIWIKL